MQASMFGNKPCIIVRPNVAASGNYLRGDGTNFVSSAIQSADIPDLGATYIKSSSSLQSGANFNISGNGYIGGTMGVGTTSPARTMEIDNSGSGTTWAQLRLANTTDYLSGISMTRAGSGTDWIIGRYGSGGNDNFDIGVNTVADYFQITPAGNIGINTASPSQKLVVNDGNVLLSNSGSAGQLQLQGTSSGASTFQAGAQGSTTINYTLPTSQPTANQVLAATSVSGSGPYAVTLGWASSGGSSSPLFARRTTDTGYASTTPGNDNTLIIALASNATYIFDAFLVCSDSNSSGINGKLAFTVPSGAALKWGVNTSGGSFATVPSAASSGTITPVTLENSNPGDQNFVLVKGIVVTGSTSGNLQLQCGVTSQGSGKFMRVYTNSYITATRVQ